MALRPFAPADAERVVGWITSVEEAGTWASIDELPTIELLDRWHAASDVVPFVWLEGGTRGIGGVDPEPAADGKSRADGTPVAYGEIWEDREEDEAELARIVVARSHRGRGVARRFVAALASEARRRGFAEVWLRVVPENVAARRAYEAAGFARATPEQEAAFNTGQPVGYRWFRDALEDRRERIGRRAG